MKNFEEKEKRVIEEFSPMEGWYPLEVQIEITYDCTLRCAMCYNGVRANEKKFNDYLRTCNFEVMNEEKHQKLNNVLEVCLNNGAKFFTITGGEPLLYPELAIEMIKKIKAKGGYASINSNGTLIDEKLAQKLKAAGLDSALISIHGENEKTHVKTVCVNGAFERTVNGIKALLNNDIRVVPNFVASHVNVSKLKETAEMLYKLGINHQAYSIFIPTPNVKEHELLKMTVNDNQSYFEQLHELNSKYEDLRATATLPVPPCLSKGIVEPEILEKFEFRTCPSGRQFMVVNVEGNASPCIQYAWNETYGSNIINNNDVVSKKLNFWKELFNTPEKCLSCGCKGFCNPCNMNILRENDEVLSPLSIPYPKHNNLTSTEAEPFKKKFEILIEKEGWNKVYKLKEYVIIREEKNGFLTLINPKIQGYTVLKNVFKADIKSNFVLNKPEYYRLLKAMDVIEESLINNNVKTINMETAPKYKILTEFVGWDFNNQDAVYCLRTDTAGRFFCLPNTVLEKQVYDEARVIYSEKLENIKRLKLVKSKGDLYV